MCLYVIFVQQAAYSLLFFLLYLSMLFFDKKINVLSNSTK